MDLKPSVQPAEPHEVREAALGATFGAREGEIVSACSCGAMWTHPASRTADERRAIELAHRTYGQRMTSSIL